MVISMIISACETTQQRHEAYNASLNGHIGEDVGVIIEKLGYADALSESAEGNRVFVYSQFHVGNSAIDCSVDGTDVDCKGGKVYEYWCKTYFEVDDSNKVIRTSFKGNDCGKCSSGAEEFCLK